MAVAEAAKAAAKVILNVVRGRSSSGGTSTRAIPRNSSGRSIRGSPRPLITRPLKGLLIRSLA